MSFFIYFKSIFLNGIFFVEILEKIKRSFFIGIIQNLSGVIETWEWSIRMK